MSADLDRQIALASAEVLQARLERDRLGVDIGVAPRPEQQAAYMAAQARLHALHVLQALQEQP